MKNVMLIHGFNGIPKIYEYFKEILSKRGYNVIIPEFPTRTDITIDRFFQVFDKYESSFNNELIVIAHSIGNAMFIKYIAKSNLNVGMYISLAGFGEPFITEGRDDLNNTISPTSISNDEKEKFVNLVKERWSIYSNDDHIVPYTILKGFPKMINSHPMLIEGIGHMGKKSGLETLPQVIKIIDNA